MIVDWKGVYPAVLTPMTQQEAVDNAAFVTHIEILLSAGVDGLIIGGSLGEASTLLFEEKLALCLAAKKLANGKVPVIMNIAEGSTREAIHQAKIATDNYIDGLMVLPPMRYKADDQETVAFFAAVAANTSLPIMLYNNPVDYKIDITLDMLEALSVYSNIQAIKESTRDVTNVTRIRNKFADRFAILCGVDTLALEELLLGADGWVAGLVDAFPKETVAIYRLAKAGRIAEAVAIYRWFMPLLELDIHPKLVQYIKLAASLTGTCSAFVRAPRLMLSGEELQRITQVIDNGLKTQPILPQDIF